MDEEIDLKASLHFPHVSPASFSMRNIGFEVRNWSSYPTAPFVLDVAERSTYTGLEISNTVDARVSVLAIRVGKKGVKENHDELWLFYSDKLYIVSLISSSNWEILSCADSPKSPSFALFVAKESSVLMGTEDGVLVIYNIESMKEIRRINFNSKIVGGYFSERLGSAVLCTENGIISALNIEKGVEEVRFNILNSLDSSPFLLDTRPEPPSPSSQKSQIGGYIITHFTGRDDPMEECCGLAVVINNEIVLVSQLNTSNSPPQPTSTSSISALMKFKLYPPVSPGGEVAGCYATTLPVVDERENSKEPHTAPNPGVSYIVITKSGEVKELMLQFGDTFDNTGCDNNGNQKQGSGPNSNFPRESLRLAIISVNELSAGGTRVSNVVETRYDERNHSLWVQGQTPKGVLVFTITHTINDNPLTISNASLATPSGKASISFADTIDGVEVDYDGDGNNSINNEHKIETEIEGTKVEAVSNIVLQTDGLKLVGLVHKSLGRTEKYIERQMIVCSDIFGGLKLYKEERRDITSTLAYTQPSTQMMNQLIPSLRNANTSISAGYTSSNLSSPRRDIKSKDQRGNNKTPPKAQGESPVSSSKTIADFIRLSRQRLRELKKNYEKENTFHERLREVQLTVESNCVKCEGYCSNVPLCYSRVKSRIVQDANSSILKLKKAILLLKVQCQELFEEMENGERKVQRDKVNVDSSVDISTSTEPEEERESITGTDTSDNDSQHIAQVSQRGGPEISSVMHLGITKKRVGRMLIELEDALTECVSLTGVMNEQNTIDEKMRHNLADLFYSTKRFLEMRDAVEIMKEAFNSNSKRLLYLVERYTDMLMKNQYFKANLASLDTKRTMEDMKETIITLNEHNIKLNTAISTLQESKANEVALFHLNIMQEEKNKTEVGRLGTRVAVLEKENADAVSACRALEEERDRLVTLCERNEKEAARQNNVNEQQANDIDNLRQENEGLRKRLEELEGQVAQDLETNNKLWRKYKTTKRERDTADEQLAGLDEMLQAVVRGEKGQTMDTGEKLVYVIRKYSDVLRKNSQMRKELK